MAMASANALCMNPKDKDISYANNSLLQKNILLKTSSFLEETITDMLIKFMPVTCIKVADLGCASGPNTFFPTNEILDTITRVCQQSHRKSPELQVFLNDLPQNDFNTVFRSVPEFKKDKGDLRGLFFIVGTPGSFYERLFPSRSMHFIHSSSSLQWLSKVPRGVEKYNKGNIYMSKSSSHGVFKAYAEQFRMDFSNFLCLRSEEMIGGGRMLLSLIGRSITDPTSKDCCSLWDLLTKSLLDLVAKGLVQESDVDSFNIPYYNPCREEVMEIIKNEGSFNLEKIEVFEENWDIEDNVYNPNYIFEKNKSGQNVAKTVRAFSEPILASQFKDNIIDDLFIRYAEHVGEYMCHEKTKFVVVVALMTMK